VDDRERAIEIIKRLPQRASLEDIAHGIDFVCGVDQGFEELERGEGTPAPEVRKMVKSWIFK
jgi:hypothetical protein